MKLVLWVFVAGRKEVLLQNVGPTLRFLSRAVTVESPSFFKLRLAPVRRLRTKVVFVKDESAAKHCPSLRAALYFAGMDVVFLFLDFTHPPTLFTFTGGHVYSSLRGWEVTGAEQRELINLMCCRATEKA